MSKLVAYKKIIIIGLITSVVLMVIFYFAYRGREVVYVNQPTNSLVSEVPKLRRALDGVLVENPELQNKFPVAVMVENYIEARPQAGLNQAQVVYEALTEGGITRFLALYDLSVPVSKIGPVRSARPYYLDLVAEYQAVYAHCGGSDQALTEITQGKFLDLNEYAYAKYYWRDTTRPASHDLFTNSEKLSLAVAKLTSKTTGQFKPWSFKTDGPITPSPIKEISVLYSKTEKSYQVAWAYQKETNDYLRYQAGTKHHLEDGSEIKAKNVLLMFVKKQELNDELQHINLTLTGQGRLVAFLDGRVVEGQWQKTDRTSRTKLLNSNNEELILNAGPIWIELVPEGTVTAWQ
ncbi:MAG: DUF3048 domain-containing protein [Candidatus Buchananbacteria bacterium]